MGQITPEDVALLRYSRTPTPSQPSVTAVSGFAVVGEMTAEAGRPSGTATYSGRFTGEVASASNGYSHGDAEATLDFQAGTITGRVTPIGVDPGDLSIHPVIDFSGDITGSGFRASSITATKDGSTTELGGVAGGAMVGGIFGPTGDEFGAAVNTPEVRTDGNSDYFWVRGVIGAERQ